jgi:hypothetical protein
MGGTILRVEVALRPEKATVMVALPPVRPAGVAFPLGLTEMRVGSLEVHVARSVTSLVELSSWVARAASWTPSPMRTDAASGVTVTEASLRVTSIRADALTPAALAVRMTDVCEAAVAGGV